MKKIEKILKFEKQNYEQLKENFVFKNEDLWNTFVTEEFENFEKAESVIKDLKGRKM